MRQNETLYLPVKQVEKKFQEAGLGLKETLALIEMTWQDSGQGSAPGPFGDFFSGLDHLTRQTVKGSRIKRYKPGGPSRPFQAFEVYTAEGEVLAYLNMLYLRKPLPCYYLVYVEVTPAFRGKGLGNRILAAFRDFVEDKGALGLLDNIIPQEDPTFDLYAKLGWLPIENWLSSREDLTQGHYMITIPSTLKTDQFRLKLPKLLFNLKKKRPVIDMQDNELMVQRTIREFHQIYQALEKLFQAELTAGRSTPLMRFMFTKFTTRLLGFRRRIQELLGYTGGESLEQIVLSPTVCALPIQSHTFEPNPAGRLQLFGKAAFWQSLPDFLRENPTSSIEGLPLYQRPFLIQWLKAHHRTEPLKLTIADLLDLGFDPTRLREFRHQGQAIIFERVSPALLTGAKVRGALLEKIGQKTSGLRLNGTQMRINPILVWILDRGNGYILRRKIAGIHWEEAVAQCRENPQLAFLNRQLSLDQKISRTVRDLRDWIQDHVRFPKKTSLADLAFFIPWKIESNRPLFSIDDANRPYLEMIWIA
jgi:GNAT superfamily N-acetyltransferase